MCVERVGAQNKAAGQLAPAVPALTCSQGLHLGSLSWRAFGLSDDQLLSKISGLTHEGDGTHRIKPLHHLLRAR